MSKAIKGLPSVTAKPRGPKVSSPKPLSMNRIFADLSHWEGKFDYMYLDSACLVTVGVGHMLPNEGRAAALGFVNKPSGPSKSKTSASDPKSIRKAYQTVAAQKCGNYLARYYAQFTSIRLPEKEIRRLLEKDVYGFIGELSRSLPSFLSYPDPARRALIDMIFNLGHDRLFPGGKEPGFPTMIRHVKAREWKKAASESKRQGISQARNDYVAQLFIQADLIEPSATNSKLPKKSP